MLAWAGRRHATEADHTTGADGTDLQFSGPDAGLLGRLRTTT